VAVIAMRAFLYTVIYGGLLLLATVAILIWPENIRRAKAETVAAAGDSICEGVAAAAKLPYYGRRGALTLRAASDLHRIPDRAKVYFCAGTNDAADRLLGFRASMDDVISVARAKDLHLIWIGPVRTTRWWDRFADRADRLLALRLAEARIRYVSLRAIKFERDDLAGDGVHFSSRGYRRIAEVAAWPR
jgi:hypothetical protein